MWFKKSEIGALLVILQRPFPVISNLRPGRSIFSSNNTLWPSSAARPAAINPAAPAPTTIVSNVFSKIISLYLCAAKII
jgi:hypothetical protein